MWASGLGWAETNDQTQRKRKKDKYMTTEMINQRLISNLVKLFNMYNLWDSIKDLSVAKHLFEQAGLWDWKHRVGLMSTMIREPEYGQQLLVHLTRMKDRLAASDAYQAAGYIGCAATKTGLPQDYIGRIMCGLEVPANPDDLEEFMLAEEPDKIPSRASELYEETSFRMDPEIILQESIELIQYREELRTAYEDASRKIHGEELGGGDAGEAGTVSKRTKTRLQTTVDTWNQAQEDLDKAERALENTGWLQYLAGLLVDIILQADSEEDEDDVDNKALMVRYSCLEQYGSVAEFTDAVNRALELRVKEFTEANPGAPATAALLAKTAKEASITLSLFPAEEASSGSLWDKVAGEKGRRKHVKLYREGVSFYGKKVFLTVIHRPVLMFIMNIKKDLGEDRSVTKKFTKI